MSDNIDLTKLTPEELINEFQQCSWALAWALKKLGGSMDIHLNEMRNWDARVRIWYSRDLHGTTHLEIKDYNEQDATGPSNGSTEAASSAAND